MSFNWICVAFKPLFDKVTPFTMANKIIWNITMLQLLMIFADPTPFHKVLNEVLQLLGYQVWHLAFGETCGLEPNGFVCLADLQVPAPGCVEEVVRVGQ